MKIHPERNPRLFVASALTLAFAVFAAGANTTESKLAEIQQVANEGPFKPNWKSLAKYEIPAWYQDAKFGIFIHWGPAAVPKGDLDFKDRIPLFLAEKFDPVAWAKLFKDSGARYVVPVAEHHDGFAMYDSDLTEWNAVKMGPKRDVIADLAKSIRAEGLHFGLSSHRAEHWWWYSKFAGAHDPRYFSLYGPAQDRADAESGKTPPDKTFLDDWMLRCVELVDKYQPEIIWFDWWMADSAFHKHLQKFTAYYYNRGSRWTNMVAINYKIIDGPSYPDTAAVLDIERGGLAGTRERFWQTDTSLSKNTWFYGRDPQYRTVNSLVDDLIDIVSKNGSLLLNIGPRPDGTIPEQEQAMLLEIGTWLKQNGEAIYDTRPWLKFGEGSTPVEDGATTNKGEASRADFTAEDIRFTRNGDTVYAILLDWPGDKSRITIRSLTKAALPQGIKEVTMLGTNGNLRWKQDGQGLHVTMPATAPGHHAYVLKLTAGKE